MSKRDIVVLGGSAGSLSTMIDVVKQLPAHFPASLFLAMHIPPDVPSHLATILRRAGSLEAVFPRDQEQIRPGYLYIAPPNQHMVLTENAIRLNLDARENGARPAIDPLFSSAGKTFGNRVIGLLLSGNLDDGTSGLGTIKEHGGLALVLDPAEAQFPSMILSAVEHVPVDEILPEGRIAERLLELVGTPVSEDDRVDQREAKVSAPDPELEQALGPGPGLHFSCPDCGGVMFPVREGGVIRFRCEVGHVSSAQTLLAQKNEEIEYGLWSVRRSLEEKNRLLTHMSETARQRGQTEIAARHEWQAAQAMEHAHLLETVIADLASTEHDAS